MRILAATTTFKPDLREAISKNIVYLYNEISRQAEVTLLIPGLFSSEQQNAHFVFESFSDCNPYGCGKTLFLNIRRLSTRLMQTNTSHFDLIHIHVGFCIELVLLAQAVRRLSTPVMVTIWQPYVDPTDCISIFRLRPFRLIRGMLPHIFFNSFVLRPLYRSASKVYQRIVVSSVCQKNQVCQFSSADRVKQISNGVKYVVADTSRDVAPIPRLLYIGHYTPAKGVDCILSALLILKQRQPFHMTFAFSDRGILKHFWVLVKQYGLLDHVTVKGGVNVYKEMLKHDLFLIPYCATIGFSYYPNVVLECFAAGLPLISTRIPVMRELLEGVDKNLLVPINDPLALADKVVFMLNDRERLGRIGDVLQKLHAERYDFGGWAKRYIMEYKRLLKGARG